MQTPSKPQPPSTSLIPGRLTACRCQLLTAIFCGAGIIAAAPYEYQLPEWFEGNRAQPTMNIVSVAVTDELNTWGWYRSNRPQPEQDIQDLTHHFSQAQEPVPYSGVTIEIDQTYMNSTRIFEVIDSAKLEIQRTTKTTVIRVPEFQINNCIVIE